MELVRKYLEYISAVRRYSERTAGIYADCLESFRTYAGAGSDGCIISGLISKKNEEAIQKRGGASLSVF